MPPTGALGYPGFRSFGKDVLVEVPAGLVGAFERFLGRAAQWSAEPLAHNRWLTPQVWRVRTDSSSYVFKRLSSRRERGTTAWDAHWSAGGDQPRHWNFWEREALAYQRRIVDLYAPDGIAAPECLFIDSGVDTVDLWLEDVEGLPGDEWGLLDYASAAAALGAGQGRLSVFGGPAGLPFLSRGYLREYSSEKPVDWSLLGSDRAWTHPLVSENVPAELREGATRLHDNRNRLYAIAEATPRTVCHLDFWAKNLFRRDDEIVLIDWAFVGDGALGEDIGNLIPDAAFDHFIPAARLPELEALVFDAYLGGLHAAGWAGDARLIQLGMWASSVKYDWLTPALLSTTSAERHLAYGGGDEVDAAYRFRERGSALVHIANWAERALTLAASLGI